MRVDLSVVAPDLAQQHLPDHNTRTCPIKELQDSSFLLGEPDAAVPYRVLQQLGGRAERVGADDEYCIPAVLEDADLRPQSRQQFIGSERLSDVVVGGRSPLGREDRAQSGWWKRL